MGTVDTAVLACDRCGEQRNPDATVCDDCGGRLTAGTARSGDENAVQPTTDRAAPHASLVAVSHGVADERLCRSCLTAVDDDGFCNLCGHSEATR